MVLEVVRDRADGTAVRRGIGNIMFDVDALVRMGARSSGGDADNLEVALTTAGLNARLDAASRIAARHPEFGKVVELIDKTCSRERATDELGAMLALEYRAVQAFVASGARILRDVDFLALLAGMAGFMERFEKPEHNDARIPIRLLEQSPSTLEDASSVSLLAMGMWFCDYEGYCGAVQRLATKVRVS
ncbi:MAG: hypothetical protein J6S63_00910 [Atopobiaceae bacterium]|nr:hypothetical protein [Atopobiaceae bacterium]